MTKDFIFEEGSYSSFCGAGAGCVGCISLDGLESRSEKTKLKERKGFSFMEILVSLVLIVALSVGAFFMFNEAQQIRKMAQMHNEMDAIRSGILAYEATSLNSTLPPSLEVLATKGLSADESVDGADHPSFVNSIKSGSGTYLDPWGQEYGYSIENRSVTCTPRSAYGKELDPVIEYF